MFYLQTQPLSDPLTPGSMLDALQEIEDIDLNADNHASNDKSVLTEISPSGDSGTPVTLAPPAEVNLYFFFLSLCHIFK
jgi:hypothetical protein